MPNNILLAEWTGPYDGVPPWDQVKPELFPQAFQFGIDEQRPNMQAIANNPAGADLRQHHRGDGESGPVGWTACSRCSA